MSDTATHAVAAIESSHPYPPRYWWLMRLSALGVLLVLAFASVRWWWGNHAERRLNAVIDAAHARGERITIADYARTINLPDDQNAAFYVKRAQQALKTTKAEEWAIDNAEQLPLRQDVFDTIGAALKTNAAFLADVRAARRQRQADWGVNIVSPMWSVLLPHLNGARWTTMINRAAAMHAMQRGDHAEAVEQLRDILAVCDSLDDGSTFLVTHLVQVGIEVLGADAATQVAIDLQVKGVDICATTRPAATPASREEVAALIARLLDDARRRRSLLQALEGERTMQVDVGTSVAQRSRMVRPSIELDAARLAEEGEQIMKAAANKDWRAAQAQWPAAPPPVDGPRAVSRVLSQSVRPSLSRVVRTNMRAAASCRLAAVALAIRLYELEHSQRPTTLAVLVPSYLPEVPGDPFNGDAPLGYIPDRTDPYIYSVGDNGLDDSGATTKPWRPDATVLDAFKAPDLFVRLTRNNAPPTPVTDPPEPDPTTAPATTQP